MNFVVFGPDGEATRAGVCPEGKMEAQAKDGETVVEWSPDLGPPQQWKLVEGEPQRK